jgi:radical SAM/Cys-rich protein
MDPHTQIAHIRNALNGQGFTDKLLRAGLVPLHSRAVEILQMNITRKCNLMCKHCHVDAGPDRTEEMSSAVLAKCLEIAAHPDITTVDITGGAPEMHPQFEWFIREAGKLHKRIIVRSNLVVLLEPVYQHYIRLFADNKIEVVASMPDPDAVRTDKQRGNGVFNKLITALRLMNERGYGIEGSGLVLDLVYNPAGAYLAGSQDQLEAEFKRKLMQQHSVYFSNLFCLNNCPIGRFLEYLIKSDNVDDYMNSLTTAFNPAAAENVMCRTTLSVGWDGTLYDCDFNQMLSIPVGGAPASVFDFEPDKFTERKIVLNDHCFVCTAGAGSSCQGATTFTEK